MNYKQERTLLDPLGILAHLADGTDYLPLTALYDRIPNLSPEDMRDALRVLEDVSLVARDGNSQNPQYKITSDGRRFYEDAIKMIAESLEKGKSR